MITSCHDFQGSILTKITTLQVVLPHPAVVEYIIDDNPFALLQPAQFHPNGLETISRRNNVVNDDHC